MTSRNGNSNPITSIFIGAAFVAVGIAVFIYWGKPTFEKAQASKNWPTVSGVIKSSEVTQSRSSGKEKKTMYTPNVVFDYELDGRSYTSSSIAVGSGWSSSNSSAAYQITNKYPAGQTVDVAYDPAEPSVAVLETGVTWSTYFIYYMGLGFAGLGLLIGLFPLAQIACAIFFIGSSMTSSSSTSPQPPLASRLPERDLPPVHNDQSTAQPTPTPIPMASVQVNEISEGINVR